MTVTPPAVSPRSLGEAYAVMAGERHRPIAGGTDLMVQLSADVADPPEAICDLWRLDELRGVGYDGYEVSIGALTTFAELRHNTVIRARLPALVRARPQHAADDQQDQRRKDPEPDRQAAR